jgi:TRAP-type C4-dicarboxylate transport system permease small subunit
MIGSSVAIRRGSHLQMNFISEKLKGRNRAIYRFLIQIICLIFYAYIFILSTRFVSDVTGATGALRLSYKYVYLCVPIGVVLMTLSSIEQCLIEGWQIVKNEKFVTDTNNGGEI